MLLYGLASLLEDMGRKEEAMAAYEAALRRDPHFADCHDNLALMCEGLLMPKEAIRHMAEYRRLAGSTRLWRILRSRTMVEVFTHSGDEREARTSCAASWPQRCGFS